MKKVSWVLVLSGLVVCEGGLASSKFASTQYNRPRSSSQASATTNIQAIVPGVSSEVKGQVLRELIGSKTPSLNWPAFPRNWLEQSSIKAIEANTSAGFYGGIGGTAVGGSKVSITYRYSLKTTMVLISTNRRSDPEDESVSPASEIQRTDVLVERGGRVYPAVNEDYPMIGFCSFEAAINIASGTKIGLEFPVFSLTRDDQEIETVALTFFSNFFQISGDTAMTDYHERCKEDFKEHVEAYVLRDFSRIVEEKFAFFHPDNECQPDTETSSPGDSQCMDWHSQLGLAIKNSTAPRCILQQSGIHRCELRAKAGIQCPMWVKNENRRPQLATHKFGSYNCDKDAGLTCQWEKKPKYLFGVVAWPGTARCQ